MAALAGGAVLLCLVAGVAGGATRYVAPPPAGDDGQDGTRRHPWATPIYAASRMGRGDTVYVFEGTYDLPGREVIVPRSGTRDHWSLFAAYPGERATIEGANRTGPFPYPHGIFQIPAHSAYIEVSGFDLGNVPAESLAVGILCFRADHIRLTDNRIDKTYGPGIYLFESNDVVVDGNDIGYSLQGSVANEVLSVHDSHDVTISNNTLHDAPNENGADGLTIKSGSGRVRIFGNVLRHIYDNAIYVLGSHDVDVYGNRISSSATAIVVANEGGEAGDTLQNIRIVNNVCDRDSAGISIRPDAGAFDVKRNIGIVNNTVCYNVRAGIENLSLAADSVVIRNNISCYNGGSTPCSSVGIQIQDVSRRATVDHNLRAGILWRHQPIGESTVIGDPSFCDTVDFRLSSRSPALGSGSADGAPGFDFDGRPRTGTVDIGAYQGWACESGATGPPTSARDSITVLPEFPDGTPFPGRFDVRLAGTAVRHTGKSYGYTMGQPECFSGDVAIEAAGYREGVSRVGWLASAVTLTFPMLPEDPLSLTGPAATTRFLIGRDDVTVTWSSFGHGLIGNQRVRYTADGKTWVDSPPLGPRVRSYTLRFPGPVYPSVEGRFTVRVDPVATPDTLARLAASVYPAEASGGPFVLTCYDPAVTYPGDGAVVRAGSTVTLRASIGADPCQPPGTFRWSVKRPSPGTWEFLGSSAGPSFDWLVPPSPASGCRIRVTVGAGRYLEEAESPGTFTIGRE